VLNLQTGSISPQFHVVFDDDFSTVSSLAEDSSPPDFWTAANIESCIYRIPVEPNDPSTSLLPDDWLTPHELEEKRRTAYRQSQIRLSFVEAPNMVDDPAGEPVTTNSTTNSADNISTDSAIGDTSASAPASDVVSVSTSEPTSTSA
jgi:hypothetical protein